MGIVDIKVIQIERRAKRSTSETASTQLVLTVLWNREFKLGADKDVSLGQSDVMSVTMLGECLKQAL